MTERNLVTLETIADIQPIEGADAIEKAKVRGWDVVVRKGEFEVGDPCLYFEIDAALPLDRTLFEFLRPRGVKTIDDREYHVLKTAKLRGVYSQGLALPVQIGDTKYVTEEQMNAPAHTLAEAFEVIKYEPPLPTGMNVVGPFPTHLGSKTDAERVQNLTDEWTNIQEGSWVATEKIDGTSVSVFQDEDGGIHVCSRNWELEEGNDLYWSTVRKSGILEALIPGRSVRAEIFGEGIQGNPLGMKGVHLAVFDYQDQRVSLPREYWPEFELVAPVMGDLTLPDTIEEAVEQVNGIKSFINPDRQAEGVVWWGASDEYLLDRVRYNFKAINNKYLLKHGG